MHNESCRRGDAEHIDLHRDFAAYMRQPRLYGRCAIFLITVTPLMLVPNSNSKKMPLV
jgi:hypothetical protein